MRGEMACVGVAAPAVSVCGLLETLLLLLSLLSRVVSKWGGWRGRGPPNAVAAAPEPAVMLLPKKPLTLPVCVCDVARPLAAVAAAAALCSVWCCSALGPPCCCGEVLSGVRVWAARSAGGAPEKAPPLALLVLLVPLIPVTPLMPLVL